MLIGSALLLAGGLLASNVRGLATVWKAWRAAGSSTWMDWLPGRVPPLKPLLWQPLDDQVRTRVIATVVGLVLAAVGVIFLLAAVGVGGPVYTNCC